MLEDLLKKTLFFNIEKSCFNVNLKFCMFVTMDPIILKFFKRSIRIYFKKGHFYLSVEQLIDI